MKNLTYPATFVQDGNYIFVEFPDVLGAFTQGKDLEEAHEKAKEVLKLVLYDMKKHPESTPIKELQLLQPEKEVVLITIDL